MPYPSLEAVGSGRTIDAAVLDRPAVFICYAEATQHGAEAIEAAVRARFTAQQVLVAHVIDLHTVPRLFQGVARGILQTEYDKAVAALPPGEAADDYVVILPDWDGAFVAATGLGDVTRQLGVAVCGTKGSSTGLAQGEDVAGETLRLLEAAVV